jgi:hypothetical protein
MNNLSKYLDDTISYNHEIISDYGLKIELTHSNMIVLRGIEFSIQFTTGRYDIEFRCDIIVTKRESQTSMNMIDLFEKCNINLSEIFNEEEIEIYKKISDEIKSYLFWYSIILKKSSLIPYSLEFCK